MVTRLNLTKRPESLRESTPMIITQQFHAPATRSARKTRRERDVLAKAPQRVIFCDEMIAMSHLDLKMRQKSVVNKVKKHIFFLRGEKKH